MMNGTINGKPVEFSENETILQVAKRNGHFIPTLCEMADLDHAPGTCRVCLVEIQRQNGRGRQVVTSCNTPMEDGMAVLTPHAGPAGAAAPPGGAAAGRPQPGLRRVYPPWQL